MKTRTEQKSNTKPASITQAYNQLVLCIRIDARRNNISRLKCFLSFFLPSSFNALIWIRIFIFMDVLGLPVLPVKLYLRFIHSLTIYRGVRIGFGLYLPHPMGVVFTDGTQIGEQCDIYGSVKFMCHHGKSPIVKEDCSIGDGSRILGGITLLEKTKVVPGAVILTGFDEGNITVGGNPAVLLRKR